MLASPGATNPEWNGLRFPTTLVSTMYSLAAVKKRGRLVLHRHFNRTPQGLIEAAKAVNDGYRRHYPDLDIPNPEAEKPGALSGT